MMLTTVRCSSCRGFVWLEAFGASGFRIGGRCASVRVCVCLCHRRSSSSSPEGWLRYCWMQQVLSRQDQHQQLWQSQW